MARRPLTLNLHPRLRRTWHAPTAALHARRLARRQVATGLVIVVVLFLAFGFAHRAGLDPIAAPVMCLGLIFAALGRARYTGSRLLPALAPTGLLLVLLGGGREILLQRAPASCGAAYAAATTGSARAAILAGEPYPDARRWLIWSGRRRICADFIGIQKEG